MASSWGFSWGLSWSSAWGRVRSELSGLGVSVLTPIDAPASVTSPIVTHLGDRSTIKPYVMVRSSIKPASTTATVVPVSATESMFYDWGCAMSPVSRVVALMSRNTDEGARSTVQRQTGVPSGIVTSTALKSRIQPHTTIKSTLL